MKLEESVQKLPPFQLDQHVFRDLKEYSISYPSATIVGKMWKANLTSHQPNTPDIWILCEYADHPTKPEMVTVRQYRPIIAS